MTRTHKAFLVAAWVVFSFSSLALASPEAPQENSKNESLVPLSKSHEAKLESKGENEMGNELRRQQFLMELRKLYPQNLLPIDFKKK